MTFILDFMALIFSDLCPVAILGGYKPFNGPFTYFMKIATLNLRKRGRPEPTNNIALPVKLQLTSELLGFA